MKTNGKASYWVNFENSANLDPAFFMSWEERGWFVYNTLFAQAEKSQKDALAYLSNANVEHKSFWINNTILVTQSDAVTLAGIQTFDGVKSITALEEYFLYEPEETMSLEGSKGPEANLVWIKAPEAWESATGEGVVVANIDSGVRYTHEALVNQYRGNLNGEFNHDYNWLNPVSNEVAPRDGHGHGSHTMGTMIGNDGNGNQIGVAPGATWIACAGCPDGACPQEALLACAEFMVAPTKTDGTEPNPSKRPNVVNNSWGNCDQSYNGWYHDSVNAWHAAGVYPVFSNGNSSNCNYPSPPPINTVGTPARYGNVTGVGSTGKENGEYATHSNKGPTDDPDTINPIDGRAEMKPQVAAPGVRIRSAIAGNDSAYGGSSGTSMSAPHVAGLVALMIEAGPCLAGDYAMVETLIETTATKIYYDAENDTPGGEENYPNYATGWGEINALEAVNAAFNACGNSAITGVITSDASGNPVVPGAKLTATAENESLRKTKTDDQGQYTINVTAGEWTVTAWKYGYDAATGVIAVGDDATVNLNLEMHAHPVIHLTGKVTDGGVNARHIHGYPLYAKITIVAEGFQTSVYTDPFTGEYDVELYGTTEYTLTTEAILPGYETDVATLTFAEDTVRDIQLHPVEACTAPGYKPELPVFYHWEGTSHGFTAGGENSSWAAGPFTSGPGRAVSGSSGIATNPAGNYNSYEESWMVSPEIDLTFLEDKTPVIQYWNWLYTESDSYLWDVAALQVTKDGGATWIDVWGPTMKQDTDYWKNIVVLDPTYNVANFQLRFTFSSDSGGNRAGWYIDDLGIAGVNLAGFTEIANYHFDSDDEPAWTAGGDAQWEKGSPTTGPMAARSNPNAGRLNSMVPIITIMKATSPHPPLICPCMQVLLTEK